MYMHLKLGTYNRWLKIIKYKTYKCGQLYLLLSVIRKTTKLEARKANPNIIFEAYEKEAIS